MINNVRAIGRALVLQANRASTFLLPWAGLFALLLFWGRPGLAVEQAFAQANPRHVEAAFLRNFTRYVTWPEDVFADKFSPWRICILGGDPFGRTLEETFAGRMEQGRSFEIFRADSTAELPPCQIVFIAYKSRANRRAALASLRHQPVLTVGDASDFLQEGGIIRFDISDYVNFSVNLDQAGSASLTIQTQMLEVSHEVVKNGFVRRRR
ncbi:MAG: YfiR family protein [Deltaproteobacteria bacterium]|nr:YfiR family protein [Deltaproteobacteria bacterium]